MSGRDGEAVTNSFGSHQGYLTMIPRNRSILYCIEEEAESVLSSMNVTPDEQGDYDAVLRKFDDFFKVHRNIIFERAWFNCRNQLEGETSEKYIMELYRLLESCDYGALRSEMIRDRLAVGIQDMALSQQLQLDAELTLEIAKKRIRQREADCLCWREKIRIQRD